MFPYATSDTLGQKLLELASSKIDELTFNRIQAIGFESLSPFQQGKVKEATLLQAKYYEEYGTDAEALGGFSLSGLSMSFNSDKTSSSPSGVSPGAYMLLKQTGLMRRVV